MDITGLHASVESHIPIIRELTIVPDSRPLRGTREVLVMLGKIIPQFDSLLILYEVICSLLPVCLYSKIRLCLSDLCLAWITVLSDEITGIA